MLPPLYLITDRRQAIDGDIFNAVKSSIDGGARLVQIREKDCSSEELLKISEPIRKYAKEFGARLIINGAAEHKIWSYFDGVQLGASTISVKDARTICGNTALIGYSAHSVKEGVEAEKNGADFITFSPVFETPSKIGYGAPKGIEELALAVNALSIPVFALGGIKLSNIENTLKSGCSGIALISEIVASKNPKEMTEKILATLHAKQNS